ncbi:MAG TPA: hypothetical protein VGB46_11025 [Flavisolibacter sp.]|jgi:hypothetical protein
MLSEHNPIAGLIRQVQKQWIDEVSPFPEVKLARWMIKPEWARLFEGFLRLESTVHGAIPEVLVTMLTPFRQEDRFSQHLIKDWIEAYRNDKTCEELNSRPGSRGWDPAPFAAEPGAENGDDLFLGMLSSFHANMAGNGLRMVVALYPHSVNSMDGLQRWLDKMIKKGIPDSITLMIFDYISEHSFDKLFQKHPGITKTLFINLDLDGAVGKLAKMGNSNSPEVKFRECILEMGKALQNKNRERVHEWGMRGLQVTQKSGIKSLFASAHIVYAGMLFSFRQYEKIDSLLNKGLNIARQGLKQNDASCKPLMIQFHGYIAAGRQQQKKMPEAITAYEKQGDLAIEYQLPGMALTPYQQAYTLCKKHLPHRYEEMIKKAFSAGRSLPPEEKKSSSFASVAHDFIRWQESRKLWDEAKQTDDELKGIFGADWKEQARQRDQYCAMKPRETEPVN